MAKERGAPNAPRTNNARASLPLTAFAKAKATHNPTWHNAKQHAAQMSRMKRFKANKIKQKTGRMLVPTMAAEEAGAGPAPRPAPQAPPKNAVDNDPIPSTEELRKARAQQRAREKKQFFKKTKKGQPLMKPRIDKILAALEAK